MGFQRVMLEEHSADKVTESNGRWEEVDGRNQYVHDEKVTVAAADRCRGYRQGGRGWGHGPAQQCAQKATKKWGGVLCKKCADDLFAYAGNIKHMFWLGAFKRGIEDIHVTWLAFLKGDAPSDLGEWDQSYHLTTAASTRVLDLQVWESIEPQFILHGVLSPDHWDECLENARQALIMQQEQQAHYVPAGYQMYHDAAPPQAHADKLKVTIALLEGKAVEGASIPSVSLCTGFDADGKPTWNEQYAQYSQQQQQNWRAQFDEWAKGWRDAITDGRLKLSDLQSIVDLCESLAETVTANKEAVFAINAAFSAVQSDISSRSFPWHEEEVEA